MKLRYVIPSWGGVGVLAFSLKGEGIRIILSFFPSYLI